MFASDPEHAARCRELGLDVLVLGSSASRDFGPGIVDMEAIDPASVALPSGFVPNAGHASDLAIVFLRPSESGELRAAPVTNHRYALSVLGAAAACTIKPSDTVYCCIPLHHPTSLMASVGAALASGARLALTERFDPQTFESEVRRSGATLVFYAGDMLRPLVHRARESRAPLPIRVFAGSGMRADSARKLTERFGVSVIEFYASTSQRAILANVDKHKPGALGRVLPGSDPVDVARVNLQAKAVVHDSSGKLELAERGEAGLLVVRDGSEWITTNDVVYRDDDGDFWFVDSLSGFVVDRDGGLPPQTPKKLRLESLRCAPRFSTSRRARLRIASTPSSTWTSRLPIASATTSGSPTLARRLTAGGSWRCTVSIVSRASSSGSMPFPSRRGFALTNRAFRGRSPMRAFARSSRRVADSMGRCRWRARASSSRWRHWLGVRSSRICPI